MAERLHANLTELGLLRMDHKINEMLDQVYKKDISYLEALVRLSDEEVSHLRTCTLERRVKRAGFSQMKWVKDFDFSYQPDLDSQQIYDFVSLRFLEQNQNLIFLGSPGVGKTHLATAIGLEGVTHGKSVRFVKANTLLDTLRKAQQEGRLEKQIDYYQRHVLLIIDELGFLPIRKGEERLLFQLIDRRYETRSTIVTSNIQFAEWGELFEDAKIANAILDRLLHHSKVVTILGDSYRLKHLYETNAEVPKKG